VDRELQAMCVDWDAALADVCAARTRLHPDGNPAHWSVQQIVEHLVLTYRSSSQAMLTRLEKGRPTKARPTVAQRMARAVILGAGYFPRGQVAPDEVVPATSILEAGSGAELAQQMRAALEEMDALIVACRQRFGPGPMASHFALGPLSADQWRRFHIIHGRHHLKQLNRVCDKIVH
jgi:hypothetical protein